MMRCVLSLLFLAISLGAAGCGGRPEVPRDVPSQTPDTSARRAERYFKGVELYCARGPAAGQWRFGWLPGTNRLKTAREVEEALRIAGVEKLKEELASFAPGEQVYLVDEDSPVRPGGVSLECPGAEVLRELRELCEARGIAFHAKDAGAASSSP